MKRNLLVALMLSFMLCLFSFAEEEKKTETITIDSKVLGETRTINIVYPLNFSQDKKYPMIIALDGEADFATRMAASMHTINPDLLFVGVANTNRTRDMFPRKLHSRKNRGGGGDKFKEFINSELVPHIEANFPTNGYRILSGQSNSGFFTLYMLLSSPDAFDAYLASSPMIGYDKELIYQKTDELLKSGKASGKVLFMNEAEKDLRRVNDFLTEYCLHLKKNAPKDFRWTNMFVKGGSHVPKGTYENGIKFIFAK
jgi:predicted alpha/beta superfamily hydrolase